MSKSESIPEEMLSAYLDGELAPEERRKVEVALESDSELRALLAEFEQLRNEIQSLPRYQLGEDFAKRVVEASMQSNEESTKVVTKPLRGPALDHTRTYQSRLRLVVGMLAAAAAIFVACWAMFPKGDQGIAKVPTAPERQEPTATPRTTLDLAANDVDTASDSGGADAMYAVTEEQMGGMSGGMGGGMSGSTRSFGTGDGNLTAADGFGVQPIPMGEALDRQDPRFQEPQDSPRFHTPPNALADSAPIVSLEAEAATASPAPGDPPASAAPTTPSPEMLAGAAAPPQLKERRSFQQRGARGGATSNAASLSSSPLARNKSPVDAVLYLASADESVYAFKANETSPTQSPSTRELSYQKLDLSDPQQRLALANEQDRRLAGVTSKERFAGIEVPEGSELLVLEGTPNQVKTALIEAGVKAESVKLMNSTASFVSNLDIVASLARKSSPSLEQTPLPSRSMSSSQLAAPRKSQAKSEADLLSSKQDFGHQSDIKLSKLKQAAGREAEGVTADADAEDENEEATEPLVRVLLVVPQ